MLIKNLITKAIYIVDETIDFHSKKIPEVGSNYTS